MMKGGLRWNLDVIACGLVEGAIAANTEIRTRALNQIFRVRDHFAFGKRRYSGEGRFRQSVALIDVKDGETLEKRDGVGVVAGFGGAILLAFGDETICMLS